MSAEEPSLRLPRAVVLAVVCVVVSAVAYALAGGTFPPELFPPALAVEIGSAVGGLPPVPPPLAGAGHAGHLSVGMSLAHLVLAVTTGWWLYRGERAVRLMLRLWSAAPLGVLRWIRALSAGVFAPPACPVPPSEPGPYVGREVEAAIHRRGPPLRPVPAQG
ncbi:hypothetical protein [Microtetraspora malaysiensis]|uniref:hypothetical protein n=1 Tax=Microtetraspora malaysiensis TaxID=161358 RepID=UPI003D8EE228